jgi:hypothetical protein
MLSGPLHERRSPMTNAQLYLAIGVPILANAALIGLLLAYMNAKFEGVSERFEGINQRFEGMDRRFDDMRALWLAELHRVEEVLDARLRHLEER